MSQQHFDELLQRYLSGQCTEAEERQVLAWYETLIQHSDLQLPEAQKAQIEARLWNTIKNNIQSGEPAPAKVVTMRSRWLTRIAVAGVALIVATGILWYFNRQPAHRQQQALVPAQLDSVRNSTAAVKTYTLADGSQISLQPGAVLYYPPVFNGPTRDVYLTGSAFFNVHHNPQQHFKVHLHSKLTTEVLGTSFNITQNKTAGNVEVAVVTGKVLVYRQSLPQNGATNGVVLTRNKKLTYNTASSRFITGIVNDPLPLSKTTAAHNGNGNDTTGSASLNFDEAPLHTVLQALSETYGIDIIPENEQLGNYHFRGNISAYSLFTQLDIICRSTQTKYEINGTQIIVKENQER